jgi:glycerate 2-kinase
VALLRSGASETPEAGRPALRHCETRTIATPQDGAGGRRRTGRAAGITPLILGDAIEGEAREVAKVMAGIAKSGARHGSRAGAAALRAAVRRRDHGDAARAGGAAAATPNSCWRWPWRSTARRASTPSPATPTASTAPRTMPAHPAHRRHAGARPRRRARRGRVLADNDGYGFFAGLGDLVVTGPTLTNVNDFRAIYVVGDSALTRMAASRPSDVTFVRLEETWSRRRAQATRHEAKSRNCRRPAPYPGD